MYRKFLISFLIVLVGCVNPVEVPSHILSKEKMVAILIDVHIAEAEKMEGIYGQSPDSALKKYLIDEVKFFKKHKIDTAQYRKSFDFYSQHVELLDEIYGMVIDSLTYREAIEKKKAGKKTEEIQSNQQKEANTISDSAKNKNYQEKIRLQRERRKNHNREVKSSNVGR